MKNSLKRPAHGKEFPNSVQMTLQIWWPHVSAPILNSACSPQILGSTS